MLRLQLFVRFKIVNEGSRIHSYHCVISSSSAKIVAVLHGNFFFKSVSDTSDNPDLSPRSTSNPVFAVNIAKDSNGLGLGLIDGLVSILST
jgi:hypothetical protein